MPRDQFMFHVFRCGIGPTGVHTLSIGTGHTCKPYLELQSAIIALYMAGVGVASRFSP